MKGLFQEKIAHKGGSYGFFQPQGYNKQKENKVRNFIIHAFSDAPLIHLIVFSAPSTFYWRGTDFQKKKATWEGQSKFFLCGGDYKNLGESFAGDMSKNV